MLLSWPNSTLANYILFQKKERKKENSLHLEMKNIVFPTSSGLKLIPQKPSMDPSEIAQGQRPRVWENLKKKKTAVSREYSGHP